MRFSMALALLSWTVCLWTLSANVGFASTYERQFFDPDKKEWVTYYTVPGMGGKPPVKRTLIDYETRYPVGTIIVDTSERRLYHVIAPNKAMKYGVGVGREGFQWSGTNRITRKAKWPGWTPPPQMRARARAQGKRLPAHMKGGPNNPLGARALYIGSTLYRIHGSNEPWTIGQAVSSGCIRMVNEDVIHLYENVRVGAKVVVLR